MKGTIVPGFVAGVLAALVAAVLPARAQPDPFGPMQALRVTPPAPAPDVTFQDLG